MGKICVIILTLIILFHPSSALATETDPRFIDGFEILTGFSSAKIHEKSDYHLVPVLVDFSFNLNSQLSKIGINLNQPLEFQLEPFVSAITQPEKGVETGSNLMLKFGLFEESAKLQPYVKFGLGMLFMTLHTREQGSQFDFTEQLGCGVNYFLTKNTAVTIEGRYRHLSNSGIDKPNHGINNYFILTGLTYRY